MTRPFIGVTLPDRGGAMQWLFLRLNLRLAGGRGVRISTSRPRDLKGLQGLIVSGGSDIAPELYGQTRVVAEEAKRAVRGRHLFRSLARLLASLVLLVLRRLFGLSRPPDSDPERDRLESGLLGEALDRGLPVLGICRGMQMLNVVRGGALHQDIADFYENVSPPQSVLPVKRISVEPGTKLLDILGTGSLRVNALHHQSVRETGQGLIVAARDGAGIVQAIEGIDRDGDGPLVLGVQWHPEFMVQYRRQRRIFRALVTEAGERGGRDQ